MICRSADMGVSPKTLENCLTEHAAGLERMNRLYDYYNGKHKILDRRQGANGAPNNRVVANYPKYITDTAVGYMFGNPVSYELPGNPAAFGDMAEAFRRADMDTHDSELGKYLSVFGVGYELAYLSARDGGFEPKAAVIDPRQAFVVYDDTVERRPLFGVYFYNSSDGEGRGTKLVNVYTPSETEVYEMKDGGGSAPQFVKSDPHGFGGVPLVEYWNNEEGHGDFEHVLSLIDAYNTLQSDRVNDKERFVSAILVIKNAELEEGKENEILRSGVLQLSGENNDVHYLTKTLNETETETLSRALSADIHKFSQTPDFTDENFAGNASGVAMKFKLISLEYLAKVKERFFTEGLRGRLTLFSNILAVLGKPKLDADAVTITFNRTLPINEFETAQTLAIYKNAGIVSDSTLLSQVSFVKNRDGELEALRAQRDEESAAFRDDYIPMT